MSMVWLVRPSTAGVLSQRALHARVSEGAQLSAWHGVHECGVVAAVVWDAEG